MSSLKKAVEAADMVVGILDFANILLDTRAESTDGTHGERLVFEADHVPNRSRLRVTVEVVEVD